MLGRMCIRCARAVVTSPYEQAAATQALAQKSARVLAHTEPQHEESASPPVEGLGEHERSYDSQLGDNTPASNFLSQRSGLIAVKAGMTADWDSNGFRRPLTVLWVDECQVTRVLSPESDGYFALQVGASSAKRKRLRDADLGQFDSRDLPVRHKLAEFKVSGGCTLPVGTLLSAEHFVAGQHVDVIGTSTGKGFAGVMKRHGFSGQPATHGTTQVHRKPGSVGSMDAGRVFPGKKLPGRMGNKKTTTHSLWLYKVDGRNNLLFVQGSVPGKPGSYVKVRDAIRKPPPPLSSHFPTVAEPAHSVSVASPTKDPLARRL